MLSSSILGKLYYIWTYSIAYSWLQTIYRGFSRSFKNSRLVHLFVRDSRVEPIYESSLFARALKWIFDLITGLFSKLFALISRLAEGSVTKRFVNRFIKSSFFINYETFLGGFILLMFIVPHNYWSNTYALLSVIGLFVLFQLMVSAGARKQFYVHNLGFPLLLFAIACVFSLGFSNDRSDSLRVLLFYVTALMFVYLIAADITTKERLMKLLGFIYFAVLITSLFAVYQRLVGVSVSASLTDLDSNKGVPGRVFSTLGNPNNYAEFLVIMTPLAAVFAANRKREWVKLGFCLALALPALALLMTYSRSGWISIFLALIIFVYYVNKKLLPAFFLLCFAAIPLLPDSVITRLGTLAGGDSSNLFRIYIWIGCIQIVRDFFLTGIGLGPGSFATIYPAYADKHALIGAPHSHMVYMELIIELGILGFIAFMWYMLRLWKDSASEATHGRDKTTVYVLAACVASLIGIAFTFSVEYVWYYPRTFFAYFILAGITMAAINLSKSEKSSD